MPLSSTVFLGKGIYFVLLAEDNILVLLGDINILHFLRSSVFRGLFSGSLVLYKAQTWVL